MQIKRLKDWDEKNIYHHIYRRIYVNHRTFVYVIYRQKSKERKQQRYRKILINNIAITKKSIGGLSGPTLKLLRGERILAGLEHLKWREIPAVIAKS